jgi:predicted DNA-binding transcriptional regulator YafY
MLAGRLLSILMLLQTRGRLSATSLAREFEVSVRTIHRDVDQLSAAGVPVYADRGRNGGFQLMDGYRTKLTGMTQSEAEALMFAGLPGPAAQLGLSDLLSAARLKLLAAMPSNMQSNAERIASRFHLDPIPWFRGADPLPALQPIARAVWTERYVKLRYLPAGETEQRARKLGPLGLVLKGGVWYLVAQSGKQIRTYRIANIESADVTEETFARPKRFDLAAHWAQSSRDYIAGVYRAEANIRLSPDGAKRLDYLGSFAKEAALKSAGKPDRDGWIRCTVPIESGDYGVRELLHFGEEIEIVGPQALRTRAAAMLQTMSKRHA